MCAELPDVEDDENDSDVENAGMKFILTLLA